MIAPTRIIAVDDDPSLLDTLFKYFSRRGYEITIAQTADQLLASPEQFDIALLDLIMPGMDGLAVCRSLRKKSKIPIIMLSGESDDVDKVANLEVGVDDYVVKPCSNRELEARINAILRRVAAPDRRIDESLRATYSFANWTLDLTRCELRDSDGAIQVLTGGEFNMLKVLLDNPNRILSRDQLLDLSRGREVTAYDRSVDVQIGRLRKLLKDDQKDLIKTFRGGGYMLATTVTRSVN